MTINLSVFYVRTNIVDVNCFFSKLLNFVWFQMKKVIQFTYGGKPHENDCFREFFSEEWEHLSNRNKVNGNINYTKYLKKFYGWKNPKSRRYTCSKFRGERPGPCNWLKLMNEIFWLKLVFPLWMNLNITKGIKIIRNLGTLKKKFLFFYYK